MEVMIAVPPQTFVVKERETVTLTFNALVLWCVARTTVVVGPLTAPMTVVRSQVIDSWLLEYLVHKKFSNFSYYYHRAIDWISRYDRGIRTFSD